MGRSFVEAVESYLLDRNIFSSSKPSFSSYNFYLNKVIYGDVSWRIKDSEKSVFKTGFPFDPDVPAEDNGEKDLSNEHDAEPVFLHTKNLIIVLLEFLTLSSCILDVRSRTSRNSNPTRSRRA